MDFQTARSLFTSRCPYNSAFPYEEDSFIQTVIPIENIHFFTEAARNGETMSSQSKAKVLRLIEIPQHDPIWVSFLYFNGQQWVPRQDGKVRIVDGNHRTVAKIRRGNTTTGVILPQSHYEAYQLWDRN